MVFFDDPFSKNSNDDWLKKMRAQAEKNETLEKVKKLIDNDPEYQEKCKNADEKIKLMKDEINRLNEEKVKLRIEIGNRKLKEMGSKYKLKMTDPRNPFEGTIFDF